MDDVSHGGDMSGEDKRGRSPERLTMDVLRLTSPGKKTVRYLELERHKKGKQSMKKGELTRFESSYANTKRPNGIPRNAFGENLYINDVKHALNAINGKDKKRKANGQEIQTTSNGVAPH